MLYSKKVGTLPVKGCDKEKQTNEIKIAAPMLDAIDISGRTITADALLTQRTLAQYIVGRGAHYHFTVKANQALLLDDIVCYFKDDSIPPGFTQTGNGAHGRIETRQIWTTTALNEYVNFPFVRQAFKVKRQSINKKTGNISEEVVYGISSIPSEQATPEQILNDNRKHWSIESFHYMIDWNYDEDRSQIRTGFGPENITRLRRFAIALLKSKKKTKTIPEMMKNLMLNRRAVFDYLKMTRNSNAISVF